MDAIVSNHVFLILSLLSKPKAAGLFFVNNRVFYCDLTYRYKPAISLGVLPTHVLRPHLICVVIKWKFDLASLWFEQFDL